MALTVADVYQHQGLGQLLLERLARVAGAHGVEWFSFSVLGDNRAMQRLLERHGVWLHFEAGQGEALVPAAHFLGRTDGTEILSDSTRTALPPRRLPALTESAQPQLITATLHVGRLTLQGAGLGRVQGRGSIMVVGHDSWVL